MKLKNRRMLSVLIAIIMVLTMMPLHPLEVKAAATSAIDLGTPVSVTETTYQLSNATFGSTGVVNGAGGYFTVAVNNGSIAVGALPSGITELINGIKISGIVTDQSTSVNRVFNFSNGNTYEDILDVIQKLTFTKAVGQTQSVTVNVAPGAPLTDGKTSVRTYNGRHFVYVQRQATTMTFKDAVTIATNNSGHLLEPKANNPQEIFAIASMFKEFKSAFMGNWSFLTFIGATNTTAPNWDTSSYSATRYVSNGQSTGLDTSNEFVANGAYDHLTLLLDTTSNKIGYLAVNNTHGNSSGYFDPGVIVEYNSGVISNNITATKYIGISEMGGSVGISGVAKVGETLTADLSGITYSPDTSDNVPTYQWYRNGVAITNATGSSYTLTADDFGAAITVMVTADDTHATGSVTSAAADGAEAPAAPVEVSKTATSITLQAVTGQEYSIDGGVTWQDSSTFAGLMPGTDYTIVTRVKATATQLASAISTGTVIRTVASNAGLEDLTLSSGTLSPAVAADTTNYTTSVPNSVSDTTVTATVYDAVYFTVTASVYNSEGMLVQGPINLTSGVASDSLPLSVGINTIKVFVTAQDGTTQTYIVTLTRASRNDSGTNGSPAPTPAPAPASGVKTTVNNEDSSFATGTTANNVTTVVIDQDKLSAHLSKGNGQQLNVLVPGDGDIKVVGLTAATLKQLSDTGSTLNIENLLAIYPIPSTQLDLGSIAKQWNGAPLGEIAVDIDIKRSSDALKAAAKDQATKGGYDLLVNPVDLSLNFTYHNQTVKPDQLKDYAPRYIALPEGIDPNKITTGVIVNPDGTVFHVPTVVTKINNRYFAMINDLRSQGSYSVIWNPQNFDDVKSHWAQASINNIAARLQLAGTGNNTFSPNRSIDRSEFATIVASGLGLMRQGVSGTPYSDVAPSSWYHDAVTIASEFGVIKGFEDGAFHGSERITREQGIAMIARSLHIVQPQEALSASEINQILAPYSDMDQISGYARESAAQLIKAGILQGIGKQQLNPKAEMTRAETAVMVERLLKATKLID
ncbi:S-layer homology domain-containing protein [Paenibacillus algorifonticola]|uniref:S-layer homology domain-containing protein n=1 Tax=Paenibacillus algorifonticola TaxID=684063 RepID=A0A1I2HCH1_9BACL|nr:S-layer homology domain-containing protein [Paenibacillus algorifonticola]SFF26261.1 S-layer homology domain-containing protein [Paenibacillus algorifonticola]